MAGYISVVLVVFNTVTDPIGLSFYYATGGIVDGSQHYTHLCCGWYSTKSLRGIVSVCVCVRACVRACVCVYGYMCLCVHINIKQFSCIPYAGRKILEGYTLVNGLI